MVWFTEAVINDYILSEKEKPEASTISVFGKGYNDYSAFNLFRDTHTDFGIHIKVWSF